MNEETIALYEEQVSKNTEEYSAQNDYHLPRSVQPPEPLEGTDYKTEGKEVRVKVK